jgi:amino acid adenylation domain-containing protein
VSIDGLSIVAAFEAVADRENGRVAVRAGGGEVTYGELDRRANQLAHALLRGGARDELPVLLLLDPSVELVAGILGVLKAGLAFVALDPASPPARNGVIAGDSGSRLAITSRASREALRQLAGEGVGVVEVDRLPAELPDSRPLAQIAPDAPCAITYTSGSTGRPKGVVQTHMGALRNAELTRTALDIGPEDRCTLLYPPSVNPALRDTLAALLSGAALLPYSAGSAGLDVLARWLETEELSVYCSGVTLFRHLASSLDEGRTFPGVRAVKLGGEAVTRREIALFRRVFRPGSTLYFGLGTTETGTVTTCWAGHEGPLPAGVPLGVPAPGVEILVVGEEGRELDGARDRERDGVGELVVRSAHLARGYWRDEALTRTVFRDVPGRPGVREYRTGDLGRRTEDGTYEHLGRADAQVKVHGFRVEVSEVEAAIEELDEVAAAAVGTRSVTAGGTALVAWIVSGRGRVLSYGALRRKLAEKLPGAMVPTAFVAVGSLPRTPNGKLDRAALAALPGRELGPERSFSYPRDPVETRLAALWAEVLGLELVGIDEDFFDLGGDSLRAVTLFSEIERRFGSGLPLATLFEAPNVREQAALLRDDLARAGVAEVLTLGAGGAGRPLFCVPALDGYPFVYRPLASRVGAERALHVLQFPGLDGRTAPLQSVEELAEELLRRMRRVQPAGPYLLLGHSFGGMLAWQMARRLHEQGERVPLLVLCDSHTPHAVSLVALAVRDVELAAIAAGRFWRETSVGGSGLAARIAKTGRALFQMAVRGYARRVKNTLVEHTIHEVRRAASVAHARFRPRVRLDGGGRVVLFRATGGPGMAHLWCRLVPRSNGWADYLTEPAEVVDVPGDHITMLQEPSVSTLAARLSDALREADARG